MLEAISVLSLSDMKCLWFTISDKNMGVKFSGFFCLSASHLALPWPHLSLFCPSTHPPAEESPTGSWFQIVVYSLSHAFSYCSWGSQGKNTEVVCQSLLQRITFCQTSPPRPLCLGWPHMACLSFPELDKAVACMIRLACCPWLWFKSVCPLMPSDALSQGLPSYLGFSYLGCGVSLHGCSSKAQPNYAKFAGILSAALSQHHLSEFEIAQLKFHHLH